MQQKDKRVPPSVSAYAEEHGLNKIEKKKYSFAFKRKYNK